MSGADPRIEERVDAELIRGLFGQTPVAVVVSLACAGGLILPLDAGAAAIGWYVAYLVVMLLRVGLWLAWRAARDREREARKWARLHALGIFLTGVLFGFPALAFFPQGREVVQIYLFSAITLLSIGMAVTNAQYRPSMIAFCIPAALQGAWRALTEGGALFDVIALLLVLLIPILFVLGSRWADLLRESLRMRHERLTLVADLTEQKLAAERANLAKSQFFTAASHDLRQPLQALGLYAETLRDTVKGGAGAEHVDRMLQSIDSLESLFDELLDISKIDSGAVTAAPAHLPLQPVFARLASASMPQAARKGLRLRFAGTRRFVHTDPVLLERILSNLVSNAIRYTESGSVLVGARRRGSRVAIEVRDSGTGIAEMDQDRIFDEFVQLGNPERDRRKGLGLGLATARRMAMLLGSRVDCVSSPGKGSVFRIEVAPGDPQLAFVASPSRDDYDVNALAGRRVLVIDDEEAVRDAMLALLSQWQCEVRVVGDVSEAEPASGAPDVVIADYRLRAYRTGIEAVAALRATWGANIPALMISGDSRPEVFRAAHEAGLVLLTKPVRAARLRAALGHLLRRAD